MTPEEKKVVDAFHALYYAGPAGEGRVHHRTRWMGVPCLKCPLDLWAYQEILTDVRVDLVIETGTYFGGSTLFVAQIMDSIGRGEIITVDIEERGPRPQHPRIRYVKGSSADAELVRGLLDGRPEEERRAVILDSDHSKAHVARELALLAPYVSVDSYVIVEDTNVNGNPVLPDFGSGPYEAVQEFLAENPEFVLDRSREKFLMTFNPSGYLKRIAERGRFSAS